MRRALALAAVLLAGCSSSAPPAARPPGSEPLVRIRQISTIPQVAARQGVAISVHYRVDIGNRSTESIAVKRIGLQSLGETVYNLPLLTKPLSMEIKPGESRSVELSGPVYVLDPEVLAANGPATIRIVLTYETSGGAAQFIAIRQVPSQGD